MPSPNLVEPLPHPMRQLRSMPIRCLYSIYLFFLHAQSDGLCPSCLSTMPVRYRRDYLCSRESLLDHIHTVTRPPCHCIRMPLAFSVLHLFGRVVSSRQACCVLAFRVRLIIQCKLICVSKVSCVSHRGTRARRDVRSLVLGLARLRGTRHARLAARGSAVCCVLGRRVRRHLALRTALAVYVYRHVCVQRRDTYKPIHTDIVTGR